MCRNLRTKYSKILERDGLFCVPKVISKVYTKNKNPECESVRDFYLLLLHYSLFTKKRIRDFWEVIGNSEKVKLMFSVDKPLRIR